MNHGKVYIMAGRNKFKKLTPKTLMFIENVGSPAVCEKKIVL